MADKSIVVECVDSLVAMLGSFPEFSGRVFHVYNEEEFSVRTKGINPPLVAVVYNGITSEPASGGNIGASGIINLSIMLLFRNSTLPSESPKDGVLALLDMIRSNVRKSRAPTGHFWRFLSEAPAKGTNLYGYVQRWGTPVQVVG